MTEKSTLFPFAGSKLWPIMFWRDSRIAEASKKNPLGAWLLSAIGGVLASGADSTAEPQQCVRTDIPRAHREHEVYFGHALCRICGVELGHRDLHGYGFVWPERAEHYVLEHDVWSPGCARIFTAIGVT